MEKAAFGRKVWDASKELGIGLYKFKKLCTLYGITYNHMVQSISSIGPRKTYDLEIEDTHNFIASEICVHNCREPNLQNLTKDEEQLIKFPVRRAFIPRKDFVFVMIDYNQMEFRMMLDYAREIGLCRQIISGYDPHDATAKITGLKRSQAKTLNFGLIYSMGRQKLAHQLNCSLFDAIIFKKRYFDNLPMVEGFIREATLKAERSGFVRSWAGRIFHFPDPRFAYRAPNAIIQGGCADVVKCAMNQISDFLRQNNAKSRQLMQIHDEILFEIHESEFSLIEDIKKIMESQFPYRLLPLTTSVSHSVKSWGDATKGIPL